MRIEKVLASPGLTGFFFDDQLAIKMGAREDGAAYRGEPRTPGFTSVRQRGESLSIMLLLSGGEVAYGDCAAVQYSGAGGRDPLFLAESYIPLVEEYLGERLAGREITGFREMAEEIGSFTTRDGRRLHTAVLYGLTQALLHAVALKERRLMCEVLSDEYGTGLTLEPVPVFAQTGDERFTNADKAIIKRADVLPHGLINNVDSKLGRNGEKLCDYVGWLSRRARELAGEDYRPVLHIDVYGTLGLAFDNDLERIADYLARLERAAAPLKLRIEGPIDMGSKAGQIEGLQRLKVLLVVKGVSVEIVADEWCNTLEDVRDFVNAGAAHMVQVKTPDLGGINNTVEAVIYAKERGCGAYLGGTCNETDRSARVCVHIALATRPDQMLAKPGMGVDEGMMVVVNEMQRALRILRYKRGGDVI
ncbi:methylaspartate ammonia-lyase [Thermacetogenium phaeum DSM 12270]|uniref:methylaspartate ammonia-lyase n=1 Tax=Thermacetogenium phaeum (strain ATCC BAA-254 / DSM 26808 / PB) TaxID=1089553 RepID=K4LW34_THEPS|nr:methylaspartate ammonia-lyase [Thermacetogenium phaeum]AFV12219.1 methylaspartate ammonia-lyase [Thermacetogenium phaeum DSM 12270]